MPRLNEWVAADTFFSDVPAKAVAVGIMQAAKEDAETDLSDLFTKALTQRRRECRGIEIRAFCVFCHFRLRRAHMS